MNSHVPGMPKIKTKVGDVLLGPALKTGQKSGTQFSDLTLPEQQDCAARLTLILKMFGNANRLSILAKLSQRQHSVIQLQATLGRGQSAISNDLAVLRKSKLVINSRCGKANFYELNPQKRANIERILLNLLADEDRPKTVYRAPLDAEIRPV